MNYETAVETVSDATNLIAKEHNVDGLVLSAAVLARTIQNNHLTARGIVLTDRNHEGRPLFASRKGFHNLMNSRVEDAFSAIMNDMFHSNPYMVTYLQTKVPAGIAQAQQIDTKTFGLAAAQVMPTIEVMAQKVQDSDLSLSHFLMAKKSLAASVLQDKIATLDAQNQLPMLSAFAKIVARREPVTGANMDRVMMSIHGAVPCSSLHR